MKVNNILQLKGKFQQRQNLNTFGPTNLPKGAVVNEEHLNALAKQLQSILVYWNENNDIGGALVSVHYKHVVAKSNRLKVLLAVKSKSPNESIRGAKFIWEKDADNSTVQKHVFTHYVPLEAIEESIKRLKICAQILQQNYKGKITSIDTENINSGAYSDERIAKSVFLKVIVDAHYVEKFKIDYPEKKIEGESIVTIYKTDIDTSTLLGKFGIDMINAKMIDETTLRLTPDEIELLMNNAPYLIAMSVKDFSEITREEVIGQEEEEIEDTGSIKIPEPQNEPVIGVLDTQFDERVYFHKWVKYENKLDSVFEITDDDRFHGTAVSSIIVDGPSFNPSLEDGCGRFRVRHFGISMARGFSSFSILKMIRNIVAENRDIKVWNLSLGSAMEIDLNFISPEAAELDKIQSEFDVIFVIAGTNNGTQKKNMRIGAPADSLNSLVVNSVDYDGKSASYTRVGPVLSFFHKPDVSYYGGDKQQRIVVCGPAGAESVTGTSFAAPWISRKMAYLIHVMGLSREVAKALIIDSAAGWKRKDDGSHAIGYGIVPRRIEDILHSANDEIRFIMTGTIDEYETYTYNIPVPQSMKAHPYFARATLAYFPKSNRNQGVDYTSTEMDIHFGRIIEKKGKATIKSIDCNKQAEDGVVIIHEEEARKMYRKWDNIKHISETIKENAKPRKAYESGMWGLSIKTKERLQPKAGRGLQFGVVVTLKEMNGINRIDDFIKLCMVRGWMVNKLDVHNQYDVYNKAEEEIEFE